MSVFAKDKKQVSIFVTAGYPEKNSLPGQLDFLQQQKIDFVEVGIPFSDPMADGPVIQETSSVALKNGMNIDVIFEQLTEVRSAIRLPLVLMGYLNPVLQYGLDKFLQNCKELGVASLILPDMSVELYEARYQQTFEKYGVPVTFLVSPKTPDERVKRIAAICSSSFVYLVGQNSITGAGYTIDASLQQRYSALKQLCGNTPLFLGFGIDSRAKKEAGFLNCDGVIIGTAYLKALKKGKQAEFIQNLS